jgi:hypothetical protein
MPREAAYVQGLCRMKRPLDSENYLVQHELFGPWAGRFANPQFRSSRPVRHKPAPKVTKDDAKAARGIRLDAEWFSRYSARIGMAEG